MKKILSSLILLASTCVVALAQQTVITGTVLDSLSREGEPSAIIQFFKASDMEKPIAFTTTDGDG